MSVEQSGAGDITAGRRLLVNGSTNFISSGANVLRRGSRRASRPERSARKFQTRNAAALIVTAQMGIRGMAKSSQSESLMIHAGDALCEYLDSLKA